MQQHTVFGQAFFTTELPTTLAREAAARFDALWNLHPSAFLQIRQPSTQRLIALPRWQQAYGQDYAYSGIVNRALAVPCLLAPFLAWAQHDIEARLNGLLLNWYDAELGHYIGPHRDSTIGLAVGSPIVTISLGATRTFRLRPFKAQGFLDFAARHGAVFVLPFESNRWLKHEVPSPKGAQGRRISITVRAFAPAS
jgi:alkylated DNA repair dioxygenase AlkB